MAEDNTSPAQEAKTMQSETLVEEFSRLVREYKQDDGLGGIEAWNLIADFAVDNADAIEAALSAAEPVATVAEMGAGGMRVLMPHPPGSADHLPIGAKLYAAPPAPSVAVKALEWELYSAQFDKWTAETPFGEYCAVCSTGRWWEPGNEDSPHKSDDPKAAAQADYDARIRSALYAQVQDMAGWQPIETAPHDTNVLLAWADSTLPGGWKMEAGMASWGWRRDGVSNMSEHGQATHWMPLPSAPAAPTKQEG